MCALDVVVNELVQRFFVELLSFHEVRLEVGRARRPVALLSKEPADVRDATFDRFADLHVATLFFFNERVNRANNCSAYRLAIVVLGDQ